MFPIDCTCIVESSPGPIRQLEGGEAIKAIADLRPPRKRATLHSVVILVTR